MKNKVPTSCTSVDHQSIRRGSNVNRRNLCRKLAPGGLWSTFTTSKYCRNAALVNHREPTKKVIASASPPTAERYPGNAPSAKHVAPTANRMPIHQPIALGAHHVEPRPAFRREWRLRSARDVNVTRPLPVCLKLARVINDPHPPSDLRDRRAAQSNPRDSRALRIASSRVFSIGLPY